jgi:hypothetical protein
VKLCGRIITTERGACTEFVGIEVTAGWGATSGWPFLYELESFIFHKSLKTFLNDYANCGVLRPRSRYFRDIGSLSNRHSRGAFNEDCCASRDY